MADPPDSPIFIVGCDRSGTTLLRLMLIQEPTLHIPAESGFLPILRDCPDDYGDFTRDYQRFFFLRDLQRTNATSKTRAFDVFKLTVEEANRALLDTAPTNYPGAARSLFRACAAKEGKTRWGDKTPRYVMEMPWLASAFPGSRFVHMIRDPRDVTASIRSAGWLHSYREAAEFWQTRVEAGRRAGAELGDDAYQEIRYEELVQYPERTLRNLCGWLELTYTDSMLRFDETAHSYIPKEHAKLFPLAGQAIDPSRAFAWRRTLGRQEVADVEDVAGAEMSKAGYELSGTRIPILVRVRRLCASGLRTVTRSLSAMTRKGS